MVRGRRRARALVLIGAGPTGVKNRKTGTKNRSMDEIDVFSRGFPYLQAASFS
jgi:hypothetical protein